jgi:probable F420-dependent oxidoreductase
VTSSIGLVSSILILPQRQAPLVARQAAEVDHLSNGRLRLGIGLGSNPIEATGVGSDFTNRGARVEEQIEVMRLLWTQEVVTFKGRWHDIQESGITLPPVQRPIPIWMGGGQSDRTLERIGRMSDGWMPGTSGTSASEQLVKIRAAAEAAGRDFSAIGVQGRMGIVGSDPEDWLIAARGWQELGATHLGVNTTRGGFTSPEQHLALAERFLTEVAPQLA